MSRIIDMMKTNHLIVRAYEQIRLIGYSVLTLISPRLNTMFRYRSVYGRFPNLDKPSSLVEKLLVLKLNDYNKNDLVTKCANKVAVREYVQQCGCGDILNEVYGIFKDPKQIPWKELPDRFVIKWNFGAGYNYICKDKQKIDYGTAERLLRHWGKKRYWLSHSEMQYRKIEKEMLIEHFLEDKEHPEVIPDYKVYCFHGQPIAILVMYDRGTKMRTVFYDCDWNKLEKSEKYENIEEDIPRPACLQQLIDYSIRLSKPFPFVRCDFYIVNDRLYFGELTFTPAGGLYLSQTKVGGRDMTEYLNI